MTHRKSFFFKPNAKRDARRDQIHRTEIDNLLGECQQHGSRHVLEADGLMLDDTFKRIAAPAESDATPQLSLAYASDEPKSTLKDHPQWQSAVEWIRANRAA